MNEHSRIPNRFAVPFRVAMFSVLCCILAAPAPAPALATETDGSAACADEPAVVQIWFDEWRDDLPASVSLVVVGGGLINNGFPALSADGTQIAILYLAGHPLVQHYPTFDIYSTSTLALQERIELFPEHQEFIKTMRRYPDLEDEQLLMQIEGRVEHINARLSRGGFRPIP